MKAMNRVILVTALIAVSIIVIYGYYSGFTKITFRENIAGGEKMVYETTKGDYTETEKASIKVKDYLLKNGNIISTHEVSYYSINPHVTEKKDLQSQGGCLVADKDTSLLAETKKVFKVRTLPSEKYIIAEIPLKGKLSVLISQIRIYPRLYRYVVAKGYDCMQPVTEIYDIQNKLMTVRMKISKNKSEDCK